MKVTVFNLKREKVGELDLADEVFGAEVKEHLFYEVVKAQLASRRAGTKATKERSAVSGSSKKLYRQKGTGRARQGSVRAPHHSGGGMAHALEPKDWSYRPPRKVRIGALKSALSMFAKEGRLIVCDSLDLPEIKTKALASTLSTLQADKKSLVVDAAGNDKLVKSIRNLENHHYLPPEGVNVYDLLRHDHLIVSKAAAKKLEERCLGTAREVRMNMRHENIVKRPIILTEKSSRLREGGNQVIFEVRREANKIQIKDAIQALFKVSVTGVNTMVYRGKDRRMGRGYAKLRNWKKAIVTLKQGDEIQFFDEKAE